MIWLVLATVGFMVAGGLAAWALFDNTTITSWRDLK